MTPKQKRTLALAGMIGTLYGHYSPKEQTALHKKLHARLGAGVRKWGNKYGVPVVAKVVHADADALWKEAVNYFASQKITLEVGSCILSIWAKDEKMLAKHFGQNASMLETWAKPSDREDAAELEKSSREVADYLFLKVSTFYGVEVEKKVSVLEQIRKAKEKKEVA